MKKKIILTAVLLLVVSLLASVIFYNELNPIHISAEKLVEEYSINKTKADNKFLGKEITLTGKVKAFYKLLSVRYVLELYSGNNNYPLTCFFVNQATETEARNLSENQKIKLIGKCAGTDSYPYIKGVKINVVKFIK